MFHIKNLIKNEFFPSELPPCFNTVDLSNIAQDAINKANSFGHTSSIALTYSGYKSETSRRKFAIPNPYHYCKIVDVIVQNEDEIAEKLNKSKYSLTRPIKKNPKENQAYCKRSNSIAETKKEIEKSYQNKRYEIRLDINSFFDNIYTHSIPWAMYGIEFAKAHQRDDAILGNNLDKHMRALNYNQTNGILVGNAVSRIISEIILCKIDGEIQNKFKNINCCRYVDDYYIYTDDSSQIQEIISFIRVQLSKYELSFNENKIQINESPFLYGKPWVEKIKQYIHLPVDVFLSELIMEYNNQKDISILKYGLKIISHCTFSNQLWPAMQSRLINLWVRFPSLSDRILPILWQNRSKINKTLLKNSIYSIIDESILLNREQELIWAVWFARVFEVKFSQSYAEKILTSKNDLSIIITLDMIYKNNMHNNNQVKKALLQLFEELKEKDKDEQNRDNQLLWTSHWLLAYEITKNRWLNIDGKTFDFATKNPFFKELIQKDVKFYDKDFNYEEPVYSDYKLEYATRSEMYKVLNKLKKSIEQRISLEVENRHNALTDEELELYMDYIHRLEQEENGYIW